MRHDAWLKSLWVMAFVSAASPLVAAPLAPPGALDTVVAPQSPALARYDEGVKALLGKDLGGAEALFREALALDPASPLPPIGLADVALQRGQTDAAKTWLDAALKLAPQDARVHQAFARYDLRNRNPARAEQALLKAIALDPRNLSLRLDLADVRATALGQPEKAIATYREALALDPQHAGAHHGLGMMLAGLQRYPEAEAELKRAAELAPHNPLPRQALGLLLLQQGRVDEAVAAFDAALQAQADFVPALLAKGDVLLDTGKAVQALDLYQRAATIAPKSTEAQTKSGMALQAQGRMPEAEQAYLRAIESNPDNVLVLNNLAWLAAESRTGLDEAERRIRKAIALAGEVPALYDTLGWVQRAQGQLQAAEQTLQRAAKMPGATAGIREHLGVVQAELRNVKGR